MVDKKQKFQFLKKEGFFVAVLLLIIIGLFLFLSPRFSSLLLSGKRQMALNDFIKITKEKGVDASVYWKFREFYYPGYFSYSKFNPSKEVLQKTEDEIGINFQKGNTSPFLVFSSDKLESTDFLTKENDLKKLVQVNPKWEVIYKSGNCVIYRDGDTIKMAFLVKASSMDKVSGISDYVNNKNDNWFNITSIKTD